jgi:hypothetical protein
MNYIIVLFKNKERKKIIKKFKTFDRAKKYYSRLLKDNDVIFNKLVEENVLCEFEISLLEFNPSDRSPIFIRDEVGRQFKAELDDTNYKIVKINPYRLEELIYDVSKNKRISFNDFITNYVSGGSLKLISKINNKIVVQNDDKVNLFTFKNESESFRFLEILGGFLVDSGNKNCVLVYDTSKTQKKYIYDVLGNMGIDKNKLYRKFTSFPVKK